MARLTKAAVERLKAAVDLAALVRAAGVELRRQGRNWLGRCPFHDDREPSLVITPAKGLWHCLGACRTGGDAIRWVEKREGLRFRAAVAWLERWSATGAAPAASADESTSCVSPPAAGSAPETTADTPSDRLQAGSSAPRLGVAPSRTTTARRGRTREGGDGGVATPQPGCGAGSPASDNPETPAPEPALPEHGLECVRPPEADVRPLYAPSTPHIRSEPNDTTSANDAACDENAEKGPKKV